MERKGGDMARKDTPRTDWYELARRWTPHCPACRKIMRHPASMEQCETEGCRYEGLTPSERVQAFDKLREA